MPAAVGGSGARPGDPMTHRPEGLPAVTHLPIPPVDPASFLVMWAVPEPLSDDERMLVRGWLRAHGIDPRRVRVSPAALQGRGADVAIVSHPVHGDLIVSTQFVLDAAGGKVIDPVTQSFALRVVAQPVGMPPPPSLRDRGAEHAGVWRLRLPKAALGLTA